MARRLIGSGRWLVPLVGGVLVALSLPPFGIWPLALLGVGVLAFFIEGRGAPGRAWAGFLAGAGQLFIGLAWCDKFTLVGYLALVILQSGMFALGCALTPGPRLRVPALAAALTLAEWVRDTWPFGGVPPGGIALGQAAGPLAGTARLGGSLLVAGATYLAGAALGGLAAAWKSRRGDPRAALSPAACLVLAVGLCAWGAVAPDGGAPTRWLSAALVQGGGVRGLSDLEVPPANVYLAQIDATSSIRRPVGMVLWPEDVVALAGPLRGSFEAAQLSGIARRLATTLLVGVTVPAGTSRFRNEIVAWGPSGRVVAVFEKVHRVPFGEYVPWRSFFSHFANLQAVPKDAVVGHGSGMMSTPAGRVAVLVSYEVFFPDRGRSGVRAGGQLLVVPTNTSSYSGEQAPAQEVAASRLQAIEEGRDLLQAAPTGYSAVIDNHGDVLRETGLSVRAVVRTVVPFRSGETLYARFGDDPTLAAALVALFFGWVLLLLGRRRRGPRAA